MWLYSSRPVIFLAGLASAALLLGLATGRNPARVFLAALRTGNLRYAAVVAGLFGLLGINAVETLLEPALASWVTWDFTAPVAAPGYWLVRLLQQFEWAPVTHALTYVYVLLFPVLPLVSMVIYTAEQDWEALKGLFLAFAASYVATLPFFVLFPVSEAWTTDLGIRFLIPQAYPGFEEFYRAFSALDNSFPSMHTALALVGPLVAWRCGHTRLAAVLAASSGLVMLSTLYLGVHSLLDLLAGVALALGVAGAVVRGKER